MRRPLLFSLALGATLSLVSPRTLLAGMSPEETARRAKTVAHVGPTLISVGELEDRLAIVPRFQLKAFGENADAIRRKFFDQIILPEVLYALDAMKLHLEDDVATQNKLLRAESGAAAKAAMAQVRPLTSIGMSEIRSYYDAHKAKYDTDERLYLFRILCATKDEADAVLTSAKADPTLETFTKLAHDHSMDKATALRGGNLGYLTPDGASSEAGLAVDPAIVKAAADVKDGAFVPEPVAEKLGVRIIGYAVIWRRGTVPAKHRTAEEAAAQIRESIWKEAADAAAKKHLEELRKAHLGELNESLLNGIEITPNEGDVVTRRRPGEVAPLTQTGRNIPRPTN